MALETEIRTLIPSTGQVVSRLESSGFMVLSKGYQQDIMYDRPEGDLFKAGEKIRVRIEGDAAVLTYKGKFQRDDGISEREEINIPLDLNSVSQLGLILSALGYPMLFQVKKERVTLSNGSVQATIDEWPIIGSMLELEGEEAKISKVSKDIFPEFEFGNPRLKDLFSRHCDAAGKTISQLKDIYFQDTGFELGNIEFLVG